MPKKESELRKERKEKYAKIKKVKKKCKYCDKEYPVITFKQHQSTEKHKLKRQLKKSNQDI